MARNSRRIPRSQSAVNFFANVVANYYCCFQVFELWHIFEGIIAHSLQSRSRDSLFQSEFSTLYDLVLLFSLRSSSSCLHLLPRLSLIFFLGNVFEKAIPTRFVSVLLVFLLFIVCRMLHFSTLTLCNTSVFYTISPSPASHFKTFMVFMFSKVPKFQHHTKAVLQT